MSSTKSAGLSREITADDVKLDLIPAQWLRDQDIRRVGPKAARFFQALFGSVLHAKSQMTAEDRLQHRRDYRELMTSTDRELADKGIRRADIPRILQD